MIVDDIQAISTLDDKCLASFIWKEDQSWIGAFGLCLVGYMACKKHVFIWREEAKS